MSSGRTSSAVGNRRPRLKVSPGFIYTDGDAAYRLAAAYGTVLDDWQRDVLCTMLAKDKHGKFSSITNGLSVPRQNGKNAILEARELFGTLVVGERILHTAHEYSTVMQQFDRMQIYFGSQANDPDALYPELNAEVADVRKTNGKEAIFLKNGGAIYFSTRTKSAKRGFTVDVVEFDEAQELTDTQLGSLMSTASAAPLGNPQYIYTGTPPGPDAHGEVFRRTRSSILNGEMKRASWYEWSVETIGDVRDRSRWYKTNPALGVRLNETVIEAELGSMTEDTFARERLGWWSSVSAAKVVSMTEWDPLFDADPAMEGKVAYGIRFSPDGATVAVSAACRPKRGKVHLECIEHRSLNGGTGWLVKWLNARWRESTVIVIDGLTGSSALAESLLKEKVSKRVICLPTSKNVITACTMTLNAIHEKTITHFDQPLLNESIRCARKRPIGKEGGWGWGGIEDADVTPIESVSLAYWGVMTFKRDPSRKMRLL